jgi:hypothetical protein
MNYEELREQLVQQRGRATAIYDDAQQLQTKMQIKSKGSTGCCSTVASDGTATDGTTLA